MKIKEKNKEENFKKLFEEKGAINVEGYGEDGSICPICFMNKMDNIFLLYLSHSHNNKYIQRKVSVLIILIRKYFGKLFPNMIF